MAIRSLSRGITDSFTLRVQNDKPFSCHERRKVCAISYRSVIAVRVSGGHLCEAEAPTEPAGETAARRAAIRSLAPLVIASAENGRRLFKPTLYIIPHSAFRIIS